VRQLGGFLNVQLTAMIFYALEQRTFLTTQFLIAARYDVQEVLTVLTDIKVAEFVAHFKFCQERNFTDKITAK